ncbi:MAG: ATP-dependent helicase HepA [Myxococcaceae bacterium]|nr:ATP-dependent helicase HepA [Myxococcaceae bacterium]
MEISPTESVERSGAAPGDGPSTVLAGGHRVLFTLSEAADPRAFAADLAALLSTGSSTVRVLQGNNAPLTVPSHELIDAPPRDLSQIAADNLSGAALPFRWSVSLSDSAGAPRTVTLDLSPDSVIPVGLDAPLPAHALVLWLDLVASRRAQIGVVPFAMVGRRLHPWSLLSLVERSLSSGLCTHARWTSPDGTHTRDWHATDLIALARTTRPYESAAPDETTSPAFPPESAAPIELPAALRVALTAAAGDPALETVALSEFLATGPLGLPPLSVRHLSPTLSPRFRCAAPADLALVTLADAQGVTIALAPSLAPALRITAILHALGHVALGHVRAGDTFALWDTAATLSAPHPERRWDRDVREAFARWFEPERPRSLDECTPRDKALLGLHRLMRDRLGGAETLAEEAVRYQKAAYQRQAAQRVVAQLDTLRGSMLCDGVGLGKTYVATTVIVHDAARWRAGGHADALRVTVLAPGSVVETWEREAIPPLAAHGVETSRVRVISHAKLSRVTAGSAVLVPRGDGLSDLEHLVLSDLVVVDEAHNFRTASARRTLVLRDLLRLRMKRGRFRRVLLLTATPINNSLEDLEQECSLLFAEPYTFAGLTQKGDAAWERAALAELQQRCQRARDHANRQRDAIEEILHGRDGRVRPSFSFRSDLPIGTYNLSKYLKEQETKLHELRTRVRSAAATGVRDDGPRPRIAEELLDRVVVQRSRALCKEIERQEGSSVDLLFRPDAGEPERLRYADTSNVLAQFLPLFDEGSASALSFRVYMWRDVEDATHTAEDASPAVGLQRVLALKRLESSPVSFLITVLRLTVLHAARVEQLIARCSAAGLHDEARRISVASEIILKASAPKQLRTIRWLTAGDRPENPSSQFLARLAGARPDEDEGEDEPIQLGFFDAPPPTADGELAKVRRLLGLRDLLLADLAILLRVVPQLADVVFGRFDVDDWPGGFSGASRRWPESAAWAGRMATDPKLLALFRRLFQARREGRKVLVFSQFTDTIAYVRSVLDACRALDPARRRELLIDLGIEGVAPDAFDTLLATTATVTGETDDRNRVVDRFAPFYRLRPFPPPGDLGVVWESDWLDAMRRPVDVLFSSDVLAEGVNLQDVSVLVNFDVHWNPVRMIQRAGRVDRRLDPRIETAVAFPLLHVIAQREGLVTPRYGWRDRPGEAPVIANMILPDELEAELALRERLATKTLAIDFTLGLERGTGAEADWMHGYRYNGVTSLNTFQRDRAIERLGAMYRRVERALAARGVDPVWSDELNAWIRDERADDVAPVIGRALLHLPWTDPKPYTRFLRPSVVRGVPCWLWSYQPFHAEASRWLPLSMEHAGESWPDPTAEPQATQTLRPEHLLAAAAVVMDPKTHLRERNREDEAVGAEVFQGVPALAPGYFASQEERVQIEMSQVFIVQVGAVTRMMDVMGMGDA